MCSKLYLEAKSKVNENVNILYDFQLQNNYTIKTDINRVEQILTNILSNAIKFTNEGLITFTCLESSDGKWIEFYIADTGIGIPDDKSEIIFGRFEKLDQFTQGTGLGLYLCRVLSETLNGKVTLDKSYKTGARFIFRLPR